MHIVFISVLEGFTADAPEQNTALGGTASAICFLSRALTEAGVTCSFANLVAEKQAALGITTYPLSDLGALCADPSISAFVFCGRWIEEMVTLMRPMTRASFIAWMHESSFEDNNVIPSAAFDAAVFISQWQADLNARHTRSAWKTAIIGNAMNPVFASLFKAGDPILPQKTNPPILAFVGDFPRGAAHLSPILRELRLIEPSFTCEAYTAIKYTEDQGRNQTILDDLAKDPNVTHVGKVSQTELATRMKRASLLLAPNPWPETSCINLIQAMAAGMICITTNRAVLPETAHGFARIIPIEDKDHPTRFDMPIDYKAFAASVASALREKREQPEIVEQHLQTQRHFFVENYSWDSRARLWHSFLQAFL